MTRQRQVFTASGTFTPPAGVTSVDVLVVGAGGGGGSAGSGGAGGSGGQVRQATAVPVTPGTPIAVTVGLGGVGRTVATAPGAGATGGTSAFGTIEAIGGGGGAGGGASTPGQGAYGGGGQAATSGTYDGGIGLVAFNGGRGANNQESGVTRAAAGGGGGAGGAGGDAAATAPGGGPGTSVGGNGGPGVDLSAFVGADLGEAGWFGAGGGGGTQFSTTVTSTGGTGGTGGGGDGRPGDSLVTGEAGTPATGGGGGGGGGTSPDTTSTGGGDGGSGVVVVLWDAVAAEPDTATVTWWDGTAEHTRRIAWWDGAGAETLLAEWWDPVAAKLYTIVQPPEPEPLPVGLMAQWTFDDPDNLGAERVAARTLTLEGAVPVAARGGYALGASGASARGVADDGFLSRSGFTVCAWFLPTSATSTAQRVAFLMGSTAVAELYYWYRNVGGNPYDVRRAAVMIGGASKNALSSVRDLSGGANRRWRMVAAVYDGATIALYEDGVLVTSTAATGLVDDPDTFEAYAVGDGAIDDVEVWDYPFTAAEVAARHTATKRT
ncbi:LamG domain-containing protein [Cellulosimicrobium cellulans]|uniref:LamG domain-containing protein n=1 Tax=Cellulosimicrobium cellulans TaxID=1710 RepID=UPI0035DE32BE